MSRHIRTERQAHAELLRMVERRQAHTSAAEQAPNVHAFRAHIAAATSVWADERRLRALIAARRLPA